MSEKKATLPAPSLHKLAVVAERELKRLEATTVGDHGVLEKDIENAFEASHGKDGEFASVDVSTLARLEVNARLMYVNSYPFLLDVKSQVYEEVQRRNAGEVLAEAEI
jgi:hypothetical protein